MNDVTKVDRRARRLLRWYPATWRERYGDEFVDLMEQEITETTHDLKRTGNIIVKGMKARLGEVGVVSPVVGTHNTPRGAIGTMTFLSSLFVVFALYFWSFAMLTWNSNYRWQASTAVTVWTGAITVVSASLVVMVVLVFIVFFVRALKSALTGHSKGLAVPLTAVSASLVVLSWSVHQSIQFVIARGGIDWASPGSAIKQLAGATIAATHNIIWAWTPSGYRLLSASGLVFNLAPVALLVLALGVAVLIRRTEFSLFAGRAARVVAIASAASMALYLVSYAGWAVAGGPDAATAGFFQPLTHMEFLLLGLMTLVALVGVKTVRVELRRRST